MLGMRIFWSLNSSSCPSVIAVSAYVTFAMRLQVIWEAGIDCSSPFVSARARIPLPEAAILVGITAGNREKK